MGHEARTIVSGISLETKSLTIIVAQNFLLVGPFWLRKVLTDPHILLHVNIQCPYDRYPKLKIYASELILDSY